MKIFEQAVLAENNFLSGYRRMSRADFDRWLAGYDVLVEVGSYLPRQTVEAYVDDPDVRFLLTERDPGQWAASFDSFVGGVIAACRRPPLSLLQYFNPMIWHLAVVNNMCYWLFADRLMPGAPGRLEALQRNYVEYIRFIKRTVPSDKLTVIRLEDGLGWKQLCDFTGDSVPEEPYPLGTEHEERALVYYKQVVIKGTINMATVLVPVIGLGIWAWVNRALFLVLVKGKL